MRERDEWTRRVLGVLRHDLTLVALAVAFVVLSAGVFAFANREDEDIVAHDESSVASDASFDADDASFDADDASFDAEPLLGETWNPVARLESSEEDDESILESTEPGDGELSFVPELATDTPSLEPSLRVFEGELGRGESLAQALGSEGVPGDLVHGITRAMRGLYDFRKARPGQGYRLELDPEGELVSFHYTTSEIESYWVLRDGEKLVSRREEPPTRTEEARIAGVVSTNLHDAVVGLGESAQLAAELADIFAWDI